MRAALRSILLASNPGFLVAGVGIVRSLRQLGVLLNTNPSLDVVMLGDYDASQDGVFTAPPIGTTAATTYTGTFDGRGFKFRNFRLIDTSDAIGLEDGLFGNVGNNSGVGTAKNFTVTGTIIQTAWERTTRDSAGRFLLGTTVGGIVGSLRGRLENVVSNVSVYGSGSGGQFGGLVGRNEQWPDKTIVSITRGNPTVVEVSAAHGIPSGQWICLARVGGMTEINSRQGDTVRTYTVTAIDATKFSIDIDSTGFAAYTSGGAVMGAGTVRRCTSSAAVALNGYTYNTYHSPLIASNRGLAEDNITTSRAVCAAPRGTQPNPVTANYTAGWTGTASIVGTTMRVTGTGLGSMRVGIYLYAPNAVPGAVVAANTQVLEDLGGGDWRVSISQNVQSCDLQGATGIVGSFLSTGSWMGGIAGDNGLPGVGDSPTAIVRRNKSYANLRNSDNINSANLTGGIIGYQGDGIAEDNESFGLTEGANSVGGIVGLNALTSSVVRRFLARGAVIGTAGNVGGAVGQDYGTTTEGGACGPVTGTTAVGGLIGLMRGSAIASKVFAHGYVTGTIGVGGLVGQSIAGAAVSEVYALGVPLGTSKVGGLIGNRAAGTTVTYGYWNTDSSGNPVGVGSGEATGVSGLSNTALVAGMPSGFGAKWSRGVITPNYPVVNTAPTPPNPTVNLNPPPSVAVVGHVTSIDSTTISLPSDIRAGDYCILWNFAQNTATTAPSLVAPSGFTLSIQQFSTATHGCRLTQYVKQLDGTETTISGISTGTRGRGFIGLIVRGAKGTLSSTWTRLNARVAIDGAAGGNAVQSMGAGTSPCIVVGCAVYDGGTPPANQISLGDDEVIEIASAITPSLVMRVSYKIKNTGAAASTFTGDTDAGGVAVACVNISFAP